MFLIYILLNPFLNSFVIEVAAKDEKIRPHFSKKTHTLSLSLSKKK
jgi:hypothetical protein